MHEAGASTALATAGPGVLSAANASERHPFPWNSAMCSSDSKALQQSCRSVDALFQHLAAQYNHVLSLEQPTSWPLEESNVLAALVSLKCRKVSLAQAVSQLAKVCQAVAGPPSEEDKFPAKVQYYPRCPAMCCYSTEPTALRMFRDVVAALHAIAAEFDSPAAAVRADLLVRISAKAAQQSQDWYFLLCGCAFQGGRQARVQLYCVLDKIQSEQDQPLRLRLSRQDHVLQQVQWGDPLDRGGCPAAGAVRTCTTEQVAAAVVFLDCPGGKVAASNIGIRQLAFQDVSRSVIQPTSLLAGSKAVVLRANQAAQQRTSARSTSTAASSSSSKEPAPVAVLESVEDGAADPEGQQAADGADSGLFDPSEFREQLMGELLCGLELPADVATGSRGLGDYEGRRQRRVSVVE